MRRLARRTAPPPRLRLSEWADQHRRLSPESSGEPGRWNTDRAAYQRGMMDALTDPLIERVVLMTSARVGKTQCLNNLVGYHIHQDPAPIMLVLPSIERAEEWADDEFDPMVRDTPPLRAILGERKSRAAKQRRLHRIFPGGRLYMVGANAPSGLAAKTIRVVIQDEVDRFPVSAGAEGDPVGLAERRANTIWNRKLVLSSTPTIAGTSRIEQAYLASDQRRFWVPCPDCGERQTLKWAQVQPQDDPAAARYHCEACGVAWDDVAALAPPCSVGEWRASAPYAGTAGFHLNELYSPWRRLAETVTDFIAAKEAPARLKVWINTALGETWQERGEAPEFQRLYDRREEWEPGTVPAGGLLLTGGIDTQRDRLEMSVWAWGRNRESWLIDHVVVPGSPFDWKTWEALSVALDTRYRHAGGAMMSIETAALDTGDGGTTSEAYAFVRKLGRNRVIPIKGQDKQPVAIAPGNKVEVKRNGTRIGTVKLWHVGSSHLKGELYGHLRLDRPTQESGEPFPPGYVHLPVHVASEEFCRQITAEELRRTVLKNGFARREWAKTRERNEALDCRVYAKAAAALRGVDRWSDATWAQLEAALGPLVPAAKRDDEPSEHAPVAAVLPARATQRPRPSGFFGSGWR
jgi:phage terminase large subunit GpA-like protein